MIFKVEMLELLNRFKLVKSVNNNLWKKYPIRYFQSDEKITVYLTDLDNKIIYAEIDIDGIKLDGITVNQWKTEHLSGATQLILKPKK